MNFFSEYGEDSWIHEHVRLPHAEEGFWVDVGAAHPAHTSNTAWLRELGWRGLAIDGNPDFAQFWAGVCPFQLAIIASESLVGFLPNGLSSRIVWTPNELAPAPTLRKAMRLDAVLAGRGVKRIDYLSVDAEGAEWDVFQTFDVLAYRPRVIVSEYNTGGIGEDMRVRDMLLATGLYTVGHETVANHIFTLKA